MEYDLDMEIYNLEFLQNSLKDMKKFTEQILFKKGSFIVALETMKYGYLEYLSPKTYRKFSKRVFSLKENRFEDIKFEVELNVNKVLKVLMYRDTNYPYDLLSVFGDKEFYFPHHKTKSDSTVSIADLDLLFILLQIKDEVYLDFRKITESSKLEKVRLLESEVKKLQFTEDVISDLFNGMDKTYLQKSYYDYVIDWVIDNETTDKTDLKSFEEWKSAI